MSSNRHMSSRRKSVKSRNKRRKSSQATASYETLEPRRLLAVDIGPIDFTSSTFGAGGPSPPDVAGGVGPNHIIEVIDGRFKIFDKVTGQNLVDKSLNLFWSDRGSGANVGAAADTAASAQVNMVGGTHDSRVLYDSDTRRWFISSVSQADIIPGALGAQTPVLVAVSRTSNPMEDWQSLLNLYDP